VCFLAPECFLCNEDFFVPFEIEDEIVDVDFDESVFFKFDESMRFESDKLDKFVEFD
jgi:hypothetical protein